jgi:hypothetical protein
MNGMNFGCLAFAVLIAFTAVAKGEGAYVLNNAGGGSILPADCKGFTTIVSASKPITTQVHDGMLIWTSNYWVDPSPETACRMGFPLCVMHTGTSSEIGNGYVVISERGNARLTCQGNPAFD